jgi:hypothetical protein
VVDSANCPRCSSPVLPDTSFCANCGAFLTGSTDRQSAVEPAAVPRPPDPQAESIQASRPGVETESGVLTGLETAAELGPAAAPQAVLAPEAEPELAVAAEIHVETASDAQSVAEAPTPPEAEAELERAAPVGDGPVGRVPGGYLPPSAAYRGSGWAPPEHDQADASARPAGPSMSLSVGAVPINSAGAGAPVRSITEAPDSIATPSAPSAAPFGATPGSAPLMTSPPEPLGTIPGRYEPSAAAASLAAARTVATATAAAPAGRETVQELVAFGLVAAGGVVGIASFFLPWAGTTGIGIGTVATGDSLPSPNQWAWGMPAAIPIFLLTALVVGAAVGSDRAQQRLPVLASIIARTTDLILPMLLAGLYFGVGLLYVTLPYGYGTGIFLLMVGGCLLLAGSFVALFLTPSDKSSAN